MSPETTELIIKIIAVIGGVLALRKAVHEFAISKQSRLREEFKFAKEFIADLTPQTHPLLIEKGYEAMTGDARLTAKEITYLLSLSSPAQALKKYSIALKYVEFKEATTTETARVAFRPQYTQTKLKWATWWLTTQYLVFALIAFAPFPFAAQFFGTNFGVAIIVMAMTLLSFGYLAIDAIYEYGRIRRAEELMAMQ